MNEVPNVDETDTLKQRVSDSCDIYQTNEHQHGESCTVKTVDHGGNVDDVHDGQKRRQHKRKVLDPAPEELEEI